MKLLRIFLVVLLAVLLPIRGAMAATMLCAPASDPAPVETSAGHHHDDAAHADAGPAHEHAQHEHPHDHDPGSHDRASHAHCNVCSTSCSSLPLPSAAARIDEPQVLAAVSYPDLEAPAPTSRSDGQERPPRTH